MLINTRTYNVDRSQPDSVSYAGPAHTFSTSDKFEMKRVFPKVSGAFLGVAKPTAKMTKAVEINATTGAKADAIIQLSGSLPVGMTDAAVDALLADLASFCASNDAKALFKSLDINA